MAVSEKLLIEVGVKNEDSVKTARKEYAAFDENIKHLEKRLKSFLQTIDKTKLEEIKPAKPEDFKQLKENLKQTEKLLESISVKDLSSFADSIEKSAKASEYFASKLKMSKKEVEELNKVVALAMTAQNKSTKSMLYTDIYNFIATSKDQATAWALVSATVEEQYLTYQKAAKESENFATHLIKLTLTAYGLYSAFSNFNKIVGYISSFNNSSEAMSQTLSKFKFGLDETKKSFSKFFNEASVGAQRVGLFQRILNSFPGIVSDIKNAKIVENIIVPFVSAFSKIESFSKAGMAKVFEIFSTGANQVGKSLGGMAAGLATSISKNAILISEFATIAQIPLFLLGHAALTSDNAIVRLIGTMSIFAAIIAGGFATAVVYALSKVGLFIEAVGDTLINAMQKMSEKFIKTQSVMSQFAFVIEGYGRTIGEKAVGSLDLWQNKIDEITRSTTFSTDEVAKAIKLLVAEGSALGLSLTQNVDLLARATDVASAQGRELSEVVLALASGLMGQSQSVLSLGINLKEVHLEHSKFLVNQNKLLSDLSESEKVQLRYNEVMKQTAPIVGAATNELNTIAGSTKKVQQEFELLQIKLGAINEITRAFVLLQQKVLSTFLNLPDPILSAIGILIDFGGVFLKLTGIIIKYALVISGLALVYKGLFWITTENAIAQGILTASMSVLGNAVGVQTIQVVSLSTAWSNLLLIMRGGLIAAGKALIGVLASLSTVLIGFAAALLANPLTYVIAAATAVIFNFIDAANDIRKELSFLRNAFDSVGIGFKSFGETFGAVIKAVKTGWQILYSASKIALLGIIETVLVVQIAVLKLKAAFASGKEEQEAYNLAIDELVKNLKETDQLVKKTVDNMGISFGGVAHAANLVGESMDEVAEKTRIYALRAKKLVEVIGEVSQEAVKIGVFGTEFDRATLAIKQNKDELNKLTSAFVENGAENKEALDQIRTKTEELWRSEFELQKLRNSTIEDFTQKSRQLEIDRLRASGNVVSAIKLEFDAQKRLIDEQVAGLEKTGPLTDDQIARIKELRSAMEQAKQAAILAEQNRLLKDQASALADIKTQNASIALEIESANLSQFEIIDRTLNAELEKLEIKREQLITEKKLSKEASDQLDAQMELLKQRAAQKKEEVGKSEIIPKSTIDALRAGVGEGAANFAAGISGGLSSFAGAVGAIMSAVNGVLDFAQQLIDFIPQVLNKIANIFNSLTDLPLKIMEGIQNVFASIGNFVRNFIPNIITAVEGILDAIVAFVFDIPKMVRDLLDKIPEMLIKLLNRLPEIIENLIIGLIVAMPEIVNALVEFLILRAPEIAIKIAEVLAIKLPIAIANGLARAVKKVFGNFINSLGRVFGFNVRKETENLGKQIADGAKRAVRDISRETSQLFSVKNLEEAAKGLTENQAIQDALDKAKTFWQYLMDRLNSLIMFFAESWDRFVSALDQVWKGVITALNMAWGMIKTIFDGIIKGLKDAFNWGAEAIKKAANYLYELGGKIWDGFKDAVNKGMSFLSDIGGKIADGLKDALAKLDPGNFLAKMFKFDGGGRGPVEKALSIDVPFVSFAQGGIVPGSAMVPGDSALNDRILALLSPGEYVIPRSAMDMPGVKQLVEAVAKGKYEPQKFFKAGPVKIGGYVGERIEAARSGGVSGAVDQASDLGKKIESGGAQAWTEIQNAGQDVLDTLAQMDPAKLWKMVEEKVWDGIWAMITNSAPAFHSGGLVPAFANGGEVIAKLQPGEYVMQRSAVQQNGIGLLNRMNNGQAQSSNQTYNIDLNVQIDASAQSLDETFVRNKLIPSIKSELKKSSLRGEFVLSDRGLR
jgi:hypothetical protein